MVASSFCHDRKSGFREGPLVESDSNKRQGAKMGSLFESLPRLLLKSGLQPLARYGTYQETVSRRQEQMYTPSDTRLEWPEKGLLFESDLNKCSEGGNIEVMLRVLG